MENTIGVPEVADFAAKAPGVLVVTMRSTSTEQFRDECRVPLQFSHRVSILDDDVLSLDPAQLAQLVAKPHDDQAARGQT